MKHTKNYFLIMLLTLIAQEKNIYTSYQNQKVKKEDINFTLALGGIIASGYALHKASKWIYDKFQILKTQYTKNKIAKLLEKDMEKPHELTQVSINSIYNMLKYTNENNRNDEVMLLLNTPNQYQSVVARTVSALSNIKSTIVTPSKNNFDKNIENFIKKQASQLKEIGDQKGLIIIDTSEMNDPSSIYKSLENLKKTTNILKSNHTLVIANHTPQEYINITTKFIQNNILYMPFFYSFQKTLAKASLSSSK